MNISTHLHLPNIPSITRPFKGAADRSTDALKGLLGGLTSRDIPLPRGVDFGQLGRGLLEDSPLGDFLGTFGLGPSAETADPKGVNSSGSEIPGGPPLYDQGKGMFHKGAPGAPDSYAFENSPEGIKFAAENGYASIDIDMQLTKDGKLVATHWSQPMEKDGFYDPLGKLDKDTKISEMTFAEVSRLRNEDGQSQIYPLSQMIGELKKNGIAGDLEAKDDPRFADDKVMGSIAGMVRDAGISANLKSIDRGAVSNDILEAAQKQGFWVRTAAGNNREGKHFGYGKPAE